MPRGKIEHSQEGKPFQSTVLGAGFRVRGKRVSEVVLKQTVKDISGLDWDDSSGNKVKLTESMYLEGCQGLLGWIGCGRREEGGVSTSM